VPSLAAAPSTGVRSSESDPPNTVASGDHGLASTSVSELGQPVQNFTSLPKQALNIATYDISSNVVEDEEFPPMNENGDPSQPSQSNDDNDMHVIAVNGNSILWNDDSKCSNQIEDEESPPISDNDDTTHTNDDKDTDTGIITAHVRVRPTSLQKNDSARSTGSNIPRKRVVKLWEVVRQSTDFHFTPRVPDAYLVEEENEEKDGENIIIDAYAEPIVSILKHMSTRVFLALVFAVIAALSIALAVTNINETGTSEHLEPSVPEAPIKPLVPDFVDYLTTSPVESLALASSLSLSPRRVPTMTPTPHLKSTSAPSEV